MSGSAPIADMMMRSSGTTRSSITSSARSSEGRTFIHCAPRFKDCHDTRKQGGGDHGVAFARQMDKVDGLIAQRDLVIVDDDFNPAHPQPALHFRNIGSPLL